LMPTAQRVCFSCPLIEIRVADLAHSLVEWLETRVNIGGPLRDGLIEF
jgi:hypothetical protein